MAGPTTTARGDRALILYDGQCPLCRKSVGLLRRLDWRKRLDFGTGTFGDMGCHILDPVFGALGVGNPLTIRSELPGPNAYNWSLDVKVRYVFPGTRHTTERVALTWYNGNSRPPAEVTALIGDRKLNDQGSIYIGEAGVLYSPYIAAPVLLPADKFRDYRMPPTTGDDAIASASATAPQPSRPTMTRRTSGTSAATAVKARTRPGASLRGSIVPRNST